MKKYRFLLLLCIIFFLACNRKEENNSIEAVKFENNLKLFLFGHNSRDWISIEYKYEINSTEDGHFLLATLIGSNRINFYKKVLSDNDMYDIYNFLKDNRAELNIPNVPGRWITPHDFIGFMTINIDDEIFYNRISSSQDFESNFYKVLNFLNNLIEDSTFYMPIRGVKKDNE